MALSDRIRQARLLAGLSQVELADRCGIGQPTLHKLESGKTKSMRETTLLRLANALGQTPEWIALGDGNLQSIKPASVSDSDHQLLADFHRLTKPEQKIVIRMIRSLAIDK